MGFLSVRNFENTTFWLPFSGTFMLLIIFSVCYISTVLLHKVNLVFIFVGMQAKKWKIVSEIK